MAKYRFGSAMTGQTPHRQHWSHRHLRVAKRFSPVSLWLIGMQVSYVGSNRKHFLKINTKQNIKHPTQKNLRFKLLPFKGRQRLGTPGPVPSFYSQSKLLWHSFTHMPHRSRVYKYLVNGINLKFSQFLCLVNMRECGFGDRERWYACKVTSFPSDCYLITSKTLTLRWTSGKKFE